MRAARWRDVGMGDGLGTGYPRCGLPAKGRGPGSRTGSLVACIVSLLGCASGPAQPARPDLGIDPCSSCRMVLSDVSFAAQIVAPGEEPRFFDDLRCLRDYLSANPLPKGAGVYLVDHRTRVWIEATRAVFARAPAIETPMGSHLLAYADKDSMAADSQVAGTSVSVEDALGSRAAEAILAGRNRRGESKP